MCCLAAMKIKDCRTNYIRYISKYYCDVPEEGSGTFDEEANLNDNAVGGSRYEWFYSGRSPITRVESHSSRKFQ